MSEEAQPEVAEPEVAETPVEEAASSEVANDQEAPDGTEGESDENETEKEHLRDERGRFKKGAEARIAELTRARREAERERDFYKGLASQPAQISPEGAEKPTADQFDTYDEYIEALTDWKVEQTVSKTSQKAIQQAEQMQRQQSWMEKVETVASSIPDYAEVVHSSEVEIAPHVQDALLDSDKGPELAYHMARNPEFADRLNRMSPTKAALELGRLELSLAAPAKPATKAPPPANPIRPSTTLSPDPAKMSMDEYVKWRAAQRAA